MPCYVVENCKLLNDTFLNSTTNGIYTFQVFTCWCERIGNSHRGPTV